MELWKIDVHGVGRYADFDVYVRVQMVFFGTLAAYLAVLGMFFLSLNLIQTMILCSLLLPIAIISGNKVRVHACK